MEKQKNNICLIRPTVDVDTYIKQTLEDFFAIAQSLANASEYQPKVVPALVSSLGNYHLMITFLDFHHRDCFTLRILQDFMNMHLENYVSTKYLHDLDLSDSERSNKDLLSRLWFLNLLGASSEEVKLCLQTFLMDLNFRRISTAQGLSLIEYHSAAAPKDNIATAKNKIPRQRIFNTPQRPPGPRHSNAYTFYDKDI